MSASAQYAASPKCGAVTISSANTNRDGTGTMGVVFTAGPNGARIDKLLAQALAATTAGMIRFFVTKGFPGRTITGITFSTTTATVTTDTAHGLSTGQKVTVQGAAPDNYNVTDVVATVASATTFTYPMAVAPTTNATLVGYYATTLAVPVSALIKEVKVDAITPSNTVQAFSRALSSSLANDQDVLPLALPPGYSLRVSTAIAESFSCQAFGGDF